MKRLRDLDYTDDICLLAGNMNAMKIMTDLLVEEASKIGLKVNIRKTVVMKMRSSGTQRIKIGSTDINEIDKFSYLRCEISRDGKLRN